MDSRNYNFFSERLPKELIHDICRLLKIDSLVSLSKVNKSFYKFIATELDFDQLLLRYFPHRYQKGIGNPFGAYLQAFREEYANLNENEIELFTLAKDRKFKELLANLTEKHRDIKDSNGRRIIDWIWMTNHIHAKLVSNSVFIKFYQGVKISSIQDKIKLTIRYRLSALNKTDQEYLTKEKCNKERKIVDFIQRIFLQKEDVTFLVNNYYDNDLDIRFLVEALYTLEKQTYNFDLLLFLKSLESVDIDIDESNYNRGKLPVNLQIELLHHLVILAVLEDDVNLFIRIKENFPKFYSIYLNIEEMYLLAFNNNCKKMENNLRSAAIKYPTLVHKLISKHPVLRAHDFYEKLEALINNGALINSPDSLGVTPFWLAVGNYQIDDALKLLKLGAQTKECDINLNPIAKAYAKKQYKKAIEYNEQLFKAYSIAKLKEFRHSLKSEDQKPSQNVKSAVTFWKYHPSKQEMLDAAKVAKRYLRGKIDKNTMMQYKKILESDEMHNVISSKLLKMK